MNIQTIIFEAALITFVVYFFYEFFKFELWLEKTAKASAENFNKLHHAKCTCSEFVKIYKRNPDWLSLDADKQKELIEKYGYVNLMYLCCY